MKAFLLLSFFLAFCHWISFNFFLSLRLIIAFDFIYYLIGFSVGGWVFGGLSVCVLRALNLTLNNAIVLFY